MLSKLICFALEVEPVELEVVIAKFCYCVEPSSATNVGIVITTIDTGNQLNNNNIRQTENVQDNIGFYRLQDVS